MFSNIWIIDGTGIERFAGELTGFAR